MSQFGLDMQTAPETRRRRGGGGVLAVLVSLLIIGALLAGIYLLGERLLGFGGDSAEDYTGSGTGTVEVRIPQGASLAEIASILAEQDVVATSDAFVDAAESEGRAAAIQPGTYTLHQQMSAQSALDLLFDPEARVVLRVSVPEGLRQERVLRIASDKGGFDLDDLKSALADTEALNLPSYAKGDPEGFLFPATYDVEPGSGAEELLVAMVDRFQQAAAEVKLVQGAKEVGLTPREVVTVASLLQAEGLEEDYPKIARVIYNRLEQGMKLQLDATVAYALNKNAPNFTPDELATDSPYNTYVVDGLPVGPINNPGEAALAAALAPEEGDWLYYVTVDPETGETKFTNSYDEFLEFKDELRANR